MNLIAERFVSYLRTSTRKQDLGLEAQRAFVQAFLMGRPLIAEFSEQESGSDDDRVELKRAIDTCRLTGSTLLVAKQDRLSRDVHFVTGLARAGISWIACDSPHASRLERNIKAVISEEERMLIVERTRAALSVIRSNIARDGQHTSKRGRVITRLGGQNISPELGARGGAAAAPVVKARADEFARRVLPLVRAFVDSGLSYSATAGRLNEMGIETPRKGRWQAVTVQRVLARA